jgi:signal transduction histidine kinase
MKFVSPLLAATSVVFAATVIPVTVAIGAGPGMQPKILLAIAWLALLGWSVRILRGRHVGYQDKLACTQTLLELERKARRQAEQALDDTHISLCRLIGHQEKVREEERGRIARDIHDDLGQRLLVLKIELDLMKLSDSGDARRQQQVDALLQHVNRAVASLRPIINNLRPLALEHGLRSAIEAHLAEFSRVNGIRHQFDAEPGTFDAMPDPALDATLFRILQESLANVARHAQASEVKVALSQRDKRLLMEVRDNGIGIDMSKQQSDTRGCGLLGIADRASAAGGKFVIDSQPGAGTLLSLTIPLAGTIDTATRGIPLSFAQCQGLGASS